MDWDMIEGFGLTHGDSYVSKCSGISNPDIVTNCSLFFHVSGRVLVLAMSRRSKRFFGIFQFSGRMSSKNFSTAGSKARFLPGDPLRNCSIFPSYWKGSCPGEETKIQEVSYFFPANWKIFFRPR